ncbi:CBS domain-containing protein [Chelativorans alearense]|uniref:CBS domain-containing protein n=1 Tax=Chelativorans alearense TaxID=2681495 RepID=UPI001FEC729F|nr:CBS domain-containing protein [Chelativorans alearense]
MAVFEKIEVAFMATVRQILDIKGHDVFAVHPDDTVFDALRLMDKKNIGAVVVKDGDDLAGVFTERHYARKVFLKGRSSPQTPIRDVMETKVIHVGPNETAEACLALMSRKKIRHLPVLHDGQVVGVISIGDLMRSIIAEHKFDIDQLVGYVRG